MPRYFFHLYNDVNCRDETGVDLLDLKAAKAIATRSARFTAAEGVKESGHLIGGHRIDIESEVGAVLDTIYFRDAVKIEA